MKTRYCFASRFHSSPSPRSNHIWYAIALAYFDIFSTFVIWCTAELTCHIIFSRFERAPLNFIGQFVLEQMPVQGGLYVNGIFAQFPRNSCTFFRIYFVWQMENAYEHIYEYVWKDLNVAFTRRVHQSESFCFYSCVNLFNLHSLFLYKHILHFYRHSMYDMNEVKWSLTLQ